MSCLALLLSCLQSTCYLAGECSLPFLDELSNLYVEYNLEKKVPTDFKDKLWSKNEAKSFKSRKIRAKTDEENIFLEAMFRRDPSWGRRTVQICKRHLNLKTTQIYKWGFDKKKLIKKYKENPVSLEIEGDIQEMIDRLLRDEDIGDFVFENSKYIM